MDDRDVTERVRRVEALLDGAADGHAVELAEALLDLYGEVLARIMAQVSAADPAGGERLAERIAADDLVAHLLLLHDLHPLDAPTRIERALPALRARLGGAVAELVAVEGDLARLRLRLRRGGCGSSAAALSSVLEEAVRRAAPEIERVEIDVVEQTPPPVVIPVESLLRAPTGDRPGTPA
ncbi:NifU family protein [Nonomuraea sp. NPDC047897]|uniref:NifU family protein n=1 Tax=Nonomuraea sp. NPDC047897 TaxID=3364346 RepID=UPI00371C811E